VRAVVPAGVDLLLDCAGGATRDQAIGAVGDGGRVISIVLAGPQLRLERGQTGEAFAARVDRRRLEGLTRLVDAGSLRPQSGTVLGLDQARAALEQVAGGHTRGKVVLQIGP
jgi:NADPH:quinone reductase-like Zn-dependent oxidoreductase